MVGAGRGERMAAEIPKPYLELHGKPILWYSLDKFARSALVSELVIVIHPEDRELLQARVLDAYDFGKRLHVVVGGKERQDSVQSGVRAVRSEWVAVHDAVRPFFSPSLLQDLFESARSYGAALPGLPVHDTVKSVDEDGFVLGEIGRETLYLAQTPQCFRKILLERALDDAERKRRSFTDEAGSVLAMRGVRSKVVWGEPANIKITTPWDLRQAEALLEAGWVS